MSVDATLLLNRRKVKDVRNFNTWNSADIRTQEKDGKASACLQAWGAAFLLALRQYSNLSICLHTRTLETPSQQTLGLRSHGSKHGTGCGSGNMSAFLN